MAALLGSRLGEVGVCVCCGGCKACSRGVLCSWCIQCIGARMLLLRPLLLARSPPAAAWGPAEPPVCPLCHGAGAPSPPAVRTVMLGSQALTGDRSWSLRRAGTTLYFMSGPEAPYYFAINFIPYRTMSPRQRHLSLWHLSPSVAQIKHDSLIPKSVLKTVCFNQTA